MVMLNKPVLLMVFLALFSSYGFQVATLIARSTQTVIPMMNKVFRLALLVSLTLIFLTTNSFATVATDCTLFASASGNDANSGLTPNLPKTLTGTANGGLARAVICIEGGTYNLANSFSPPRSGNSSAYITYKAYGDAPANFVWTGGNFSGGFMFSMDSAAGFPNGYHHLKFIGLNL